MSVAVYLEQGTKRAFAAAYEWPGWCRAGKTEELALAALAAAAPRYAPVAALAGLTPPEGSFEVLERVPGSATTDFGAPAAVPPRDAEPLDGPGAARMAALLAASWACLDQVAAAAPAELRKGPRGGGRDRDRVLQHVLGAESGYARLIGLRLPEPQVGDPEGISAARAAILGVLGAPSSGAPLRERGWPARYAARRIAWHVLDHAWEIEDRSTP
ncbi:MAG: hypothetical protein NVSMB32_07550 [Actinomycetota bacterium]